MKTVVNGIGAGLEDRRQRVLLIVGSVVAVVGSTLYYAGPMGLRSAAWELSIITLLVVMAVGIFLFQEGRRRGWVAIWVGLAAAFTGMALMMRPHWVPFDVAPPSPIDILRLSNYPLGAIGVLTLLFRSDRKVGTRALLEAALATGAGSVIIWLAVLKPMSETTDATGLERVVAFAYPLADVLLLAVLSIVIVHLGKRPGSLLLVAMALFGNLAADVAFAHQNLTGSYEPGGLLDVGWMLCFAALALAPSWPLPERVTVVGDDGAVRGARFGYLAMAALIAPGAVLIEAVNGNEIDTALAFAALLLTVLALVRLAVFNHDLDTSRAEVAELVDELTESNAELESTRADLRKVLDRVHTLVEEERTRIAAEIHDRPLQHLAVVGYQLERLKLRLGKGDIEGATTLCAQASQDLATELNGLRSLMTDIRPPVLDERGLLGALRDRAAELNGENTGMRVVVSGSVDRLQPDVETTIYRVALEALENVRRHADATKVTVDLEIGEVDHIARLTIVDNGCGFDVSAINRFVREGHFGLAVMRERVELIGGTMDIPAVPNGTTIVFAVPTRPVASTTDSSAALIMEKAQ